MVNKIGGYGHSMAKFPLRVSSGSGLVVGVCLLYQLYSEAKAGGFFYIRYIAKACLKTKNTKQLVFSGH